PAAWIAAIRALLANPEARASAGRALQDAVCAQMDGLPAYLARWRAAWAHPDAAPAANLTLPPKDQDDPTPVLFDALLQAFPPSATHADAAPARQRTTAIPSTPTTTKSSTSEDEEAAAKAERRSRITAQRSPDAASALLDEDYTVFLERRALIPSDQQFLQKAMAKWSSEPVIHVLTEARNSEFELLSNTLDSLGAQPYSLWSLSILADVPCPDPAIAELPNIDWLHRTDPAQPAKAIFDAIVAQRDCDVVVYLPPGTELDPLCLWRVAHEFATRAQWMALYADDDVVRVDGNRVEPRFKPDLNVDFLRSCDYIGPLWVRGSVFRRAGGFAECAGTRLYDLSLRVLDLVGRTAIGHIADPLLSLPVSPTLLISDRDAHAAVSAHLTRNGLAHRVMPGALHATWRVEYQHAAQPRVDIVLAYRNQLEFIEPAVDSLFRQTRWPNFRLILVDNDSDDADCAAWAERIQTQHGEQVVRLRHPGAPNRAAAFNAGARHSDADYVLFLHHDVQMLAAHWLDRLMSHAMRPEVAVVAPRQASPGDHALEFSGSVFALPPGIGSPELDDTLLNYPGYLGRLQTDQNFALLNSACLLVRRSCFDAAGGFDENLGLIGCETDLSARLARHGLLVWTPWATIAHYAEDMPTIESATEAACIAESAQHHSAVATQRNLLISRYMAPLGRDRAWNTNLRLVHDEAKVESGFAVEWHTVPADVPRIVADMVTGAGEFRAIAPLRAARRVGKAQAAIFHPPSRDVRRMCTAMDLARLEGVDSVIVHNPAVAPQVNLLRQIRTHHPDALLIAALDDLTTAVPCDSDVFTQWTRETRSHMRRCLAQCNRLVVSTEPLVDFARHMIDDIRVVPNRVEWARWEGLQSKRRTGSKPRVGWAGAQQHAGDLALIEEVVRRTHGEVDWIFFGMCPPALAPYAKESYGWVDFDRYPATLASLNLDLAIAPLEINAFNEAKSNLRLLDYGILGWPVVCTDITPYRGAPVTRVNNSSQEWIEAIRAHVHDLDAAERAGDALREWVLSDYILEEHVDDWLAHHLP
ncbi:MAG: glycosyltransferase, partial [Rhodocyclaceae bacterium]|nr:glycosyltransferase [Rhodocyclaceae bacterium]